MKTINVKAQKKTLRPYVLGGIVCLAIVVIPSMLEKFEAVPFRNMDIMRPHVHAEEYTPVEVDPKASNNLQTVYAFVSSYPDSRISHDYIDAMYSHCGNVETVKQAVAIATAETGQGKNTPLENNYFGWHLNGDKWHDPDMNTMARQITEGIENYYSEVGTDSTIANVYTGGDSTSTWLSIYQWAIGQM